MAYQKSSGNSESLWTNRNAAFGRVVRQMRKANGLTQEQLAWNIEMSRVYLSELERGLREPCLGTILKLAHMLKVSPGTLLDAMDV